MSNHALLQLTMLAEIRFHTALTGHFSAVNYLKVVKELPPDITLTGIEFLFDDMPVILNALHMHGTGYHTICDLNSDEIRKWPR